MPEDASGPHLETVAPVITSLPRSESPSRLEDDDEVDDEKTLGGSKFSTRRGKEDLEGGIRIDMTETPARGRTMSNIHNVSLHPPLFDYFIECQVAKEKKRFSQLNNDRGSEERRARQRRYSTVFHLPLQRRCVF